MTRRAGAIDVTSAQRLTPHAPVSRLSGVGPKRALALARLGIRTVGELLAHFPRRYEDRRTITPLAHAREGDRVTAQARVVSARLIRLRGRMSMTEAVLADDSGRLKATWFNQGYLARTLKPGSSLVLTGTVGKYKGLALKNPEFEILSGEPGDRLHVGRLVPIYPVGDGVSQRALREWIWSALEADCGPPDVVPRPIAAAEGFGDRAQALRDVHFPEDPAAAEAARRRFAFEELFVVQSLVVMQRNANRSAAGIRHEVDGAQLNKLRTSLPFRPTPGQSAAIVEILSDMAAPSPMSRLLQGDVGCGKTLVALHAIAACADGGRQAALMAPTEVLAAQHYESLLQQLAPLGMRIALLTSSSARSVRADVRSGRAHVVAGTHALFERATAFRDLGLVIVDEQHRFGVNQRERLASKGVCPDCLHLSATPIPRSLAMTVYGAMDLTIIRDLPPGRLPVETTVVQRGKEPEVHAFARRQAESGFQVYVVCPQIETSEKRALAGARARFRALSQEAFGGLRCALLHGRLDSDEKAGLLESFRAGALDVLVTTTVIEVGVDAPRATVMLIVDAGHFGLSQLHQLRGRVGRGRHRSYCFLMGEPATEEAANRLEVLCSSQDGFRIAEEDFAMRGPGELRGERQSGLSDLKAAQLPRDMQLLLAARRAAEASIARDPDLRDPAHAALCRAVRSAGRIAI